MPSPAKEGDRTGESVPALLALAVGERLTVFCAIAGVVVDARASRSATSRRRSSEESNDGILCCVLLVEVIRQLDFQVSERNDSRRELKQGNL